jgi:hypothetical protein
MEKTMPSRSAKAQRTSGIETFGIILPNLIVESILDSDHPNQLQLHRWDGRQATTEPTTSYHGRMYTSAPIATGLAQAVHFPNASKAFGNAAELTTSMLNFLTRYAHLSPDAAALLVAFALASWFPDCVPVAPILYLLGPDNEARLVLRLLGCLCRRPVLLGDIDMAALATLPSRLDATLLIDQRNLARRVTRVLLASNNRYFRIAHGNGQLNIYGAKAFSAAPEFANGTGVRVSLSPAQDPLPTLTDAREIEIANDFRAKLLRYRMANCRSIRDAQLDTRHFVPAMREEVRAWLAPICDCPDLRKSVLSSLMEQSRETEGARLSDERCVVAEAALLFCHKDDTEQFFVGDLAVKVNDLLKGRHEERILTSKKVGLLLRDLGIKGERVVKGYRIVLTESNREKIHGNARAYRVISTQDGVVRCNHCKAVHERMN